MVLYPAGVFNSGSGFAHTGEHFSVPIADGGSPDGRPLIAGWVAPPIATTPEADLVTQMTILAHELIEA